MKQFQTLGTDPYEVIRLFPDLVSQPTNANEMNEPVTSSPKLQDRDLENGLLALIAFLTEVRHNLMGSGDSKDKDKNDKSKDKDRTKNMTAVATEQLLKIIDTTLLKCYLQVRFREMHRLWFRQFSIEHFVIEDLFVTRIISRCSINYCYSSDFNGSVTDKFSDERCTGSATSTTESLPSRRSGKDFADASKVS